MRALVRAGDKSTLSLDANHPEPTSSEYPDGYLIRSKAAAICRDELKWAEPLTPDIPVPGFDLAGEILSTPTAVGSHSFKPGDQVFALTCHTWKGNTRDITVSHETELARKPKNLTWEEAASVPMSALSAYQGLFVYGGLAPLGEVADNGGKRVLVTAASGGVGIWGIQLAHQAGVTELVGTCGSTNVDFVKSLGAHAVLDYKKINLVEWVHQDWETRAFDVVLDCVGGDTLEGAWKCVRPGGKVISVGEPPDGRKPLDGVQEGVQGIWFIVKPSGKQLMEITKLIEQEKCRAVVDSVFELEQFSEAFARSEGGHARGKVVFKVCGIMDIVEYT